MFSWLSQKSSIRGQQALLLFLVFVALARFLFKIYSYYFIEGGSVDYPLFIRAAQGFLETGQLYLRAPEDAYLPGSGVYKYPPAFQLTVAPWFSLNGSVAAYYTTIRDIMILMYLSSAVLVGRKILMLSSKLSTSESDGNESINKNTFYFIVFAIITVALFDPFHEGRAITSEIFILFFISATFVFLESAKFISGFSLGIAASLKLYPAFLLIFFICNKNYRAIGGFISACILMLVLSLAYFGFDENLYYYMHLVPIMLVERTDIGPPNLVLDTYLQKYGFIDNAREGVFLFVRYGMLTLLMITGIFYNKKNNVYGNAIFFSMCIAGMLLWLPNYWLQYQIVLMLPLFILLSYALQTRNILLISIISIFALSLIIDAHWISILFRKAADSKGISDLVILNMIKRSGLVTTMFAIAPLPAVLSIVTDGRCIIPHVIFICSGVILIKQRFAGIR